jgi:hypothetical protein
MGMLLLTAVQKDAKCKTVNQYNSMIWRGKIKVEVMESKWSLSPFKTAG